MAVFAGEARLTVACVAIDQIDAATFVGTWTLQTFVDINVAILTGPSRFADTFVVVETINAFTMHAWL